MKEKELNRKEKFYSEYCSGCGLCKAVKGVVDQVLPVLKGDTDTVIASLVDLLQTMA